MPYLQLSFAAVFAIFTFTNLPRALVSILVVLDVTVKGLCVDEDSVDDGKSFTARVTVAFPAIVLKSGKNLLTETNLLAVPSCPCKSKSMIVTGKLLQEMQL